jgi:hypothetical protein
MQPVFLGFVSRPSHQLGTSRILTNPPKRETSILTSSCRAARRSAAGWPPPFACPVALACLSNTAYCHPRQLLIPTVQVKLNYTLVQLVQLANADASLQCIGMCRGLARTRSPSPLTDLSFLPAATQYTHHEEIIDACRVRSAACHGQNLE